MKVQLVNLSIDRLYNNSITKEDILDFALWLETNKHENIREAIMLSHNTGTQWLSVEGHMMHGMASLKNKL